MGIKRYDSLSLGHLLVGQIEEGDFFYKSAGGSIEMNLEKRDCSTWNFAEFDNHGEDLEWNTI